MTSTGASAAGAGGLLLHDHDRGHDHVAASSIATAATAAAAAAVPGGGGGGGGGGGARDERQRAAGFDVLLRLASPVVGTGAGSTRRSARKVFPYSADSDVLLLPNASSSLALPAEAPQTPGKSQQGAVRQPAAIPCAPAAPAPAPRQGTAQSHSGSGNGKSSGSSNWQEAGGAECGLRASNSGGAGRWPMMLPRTLALNYM